MESVRSWIQTLALAGLAVAALIVAVRDIPEARAAEPPLCRVIDSGKLNWGNATEDVAAQAAAFLAGMGDRQRIVALPVGRTVNGSGGTYAVLCAW